MTEVVDDLANHRGAGQRRFLARSLLLAGFRFGAVHLEERDPEPGGVLALASGRHLSAGVQQRVLDHVRAGGGLLYLGVLPERDLEGAPCTVLADGLGLRGRGPRPRRPATSSPRSSATAGPHPAPEVRVSWRQRLVPADAPGAEVVLTDVDGAVCGVSVAAGAGPGRRPGRRPAVRPGARRARARPPRAARRGPRRRPLARCPRHHDGRRRRPARAAPDQPLERRHARDRRGRRRRPAGRRRPVAAGAARPRAAARDRRRRPPGPVGERRDHGALRRRSSTSHPASTRTAGPPSCSPPAPRCSTTRRTPWTTVPTARVRVTGGPGPMSVRFG